MLGLHSLLVCKVAISNEMDFNFLPEGCILFWKEETEMLERIQELTNLAHLLVTNYC